MPVAPKVKAREDNTCLIEAVFYDYDGTTGIDKTDITSAVYTLYDHEDAVIASQTDIDVRDSFAATGGAFSYVMPATNNIIVGDGNAEETHTMLMTVVGVGAGGKAITWKDNIYIVVQNLKNVT